MNETYHLIDKNEDKTVCGNYSASAYVTAVVHYPYVDSICQGCMMAATGHAELLEALQVAATMLGGTCQHGYDTSRSARGCDECAAQIEAAIAKVTETCDHSWMVFSTAVGTGQIMVECELCEAVGTVDTHTRAEWQAAFYAPSNPYRWDGGDDRITVTGGKVDDGKNI